MDAAPMQFAKRDAPPLVDDEGNELPTSTPVWRNWCRIAIVASLVPPPTGQWYSTSMTRRTWKLTIHAPKTLVYAAVTAAIGNVPWIQNVLAWVLAHLK